MSAFLNRIASVLKSVFALNRFSDYDLIMDNGRIIACDNRNHAEYVAAQLAELPAWTSSIKH